MISLLPALLAIAALPDRLILSWNGDPATTMAVNWRTPAANAAAAAAVEWTEATHGPIDPQRCRRVDAASQKLTTDAGDYLYHSATITGLAPETLYVYRAGDGRDWSEWHHFRTAARQAKPLEFIYLGDAQNELLSQWPRVLRMAYRHAPGAAFMLHAGDLINNRSESPDAEWGEWFRAAGWLYATVPSWAAPGNHEYPPRGAGPRVLTPAWRAQFNFPENGPPAQREAAYFADIQGVRIVALDSNERFEEQAAWLDAVLARHPQKWTVLFFHHPIHSTMKGKENTLLRATWQPIIDKHKVDLVFTGDEHSYGRSGLTTGKDFRTGHTVYVVSVGGPKMYEVETRPWMRRSGEDLQLFQIIRVDGDRLRYESRTAAGALYDSFELRKSNGRNRLIEGPGMPDHRR